MLAAGSLRDRITVRRLTDTPNGRGGFSRGWSTVIADLPAEVLGQSGREELIANTFQGVASFKITVRYRNDLRATDQVLWNGLELNIVAPPTDPDGRRERTEIFADTSTPQDAGGI